MTGRRSMVRKTRRGASSCQVCEPREAWLGLDFGKNLDMEVFCIRVLQNAGRGGALNLGHQERFMLSRYVGFGNWKDVHLFQNMPKDTWDQRVLSAPSTWRVMPL